MTRIRLTALALLALTTAACPRAGGLGSATQPSGGTATVTVSCSFTKGWAAVLPAARFSTGRRYLMQALIGFTKEPRFWRSQADFRDLADYAARRCSAKGTTFRVPAGPHVVVVGWADRFQVHKKYQDNGFYRRVRLRSGAAKAISLAPKDMTHTWNCISCPHLAVFRGGRFVEVGQVLVDRYTRGLRGTDVRRVRLEVRDGLVRLRVIEREPEVTYLDAVQVRVRGRLLEPAGVPHRVRGADGSTLVLKTGDALELTFRAPGLGDGVVAADILVTGHYEPLVHL